VGGGGGNTCSSSLWLFKNILNWSVTMLWHWLVKVILPSIHASAFVKDQYAVFCSAADTTHKIPAKESRCANFKQLPGPVTSASVLLHFLVNRILSYEHLISIMIANRVDSCLGGLETDPAASSTISGGLLTDCTSLSDSPSDPPPPAGWTLGFVMRCLVTLDAESRALSYESCMQACVDSCVCVSILLRRCMSQKAIGFPHLSVLTCATPRLFLH